MQPVGGSADGQDGPGLGARLRDGIAYMTQEAGAGYRTVGGGGGGTQDEFGDDAEGGDDRWKFMAGDLDVFFRRAYTYYKERGYHCILVGESLTMLLLGFVSYVTMVLLLWVDWSKLLGCREHDGCHDITPFVTGVRMSGSLSELVSLIFVLGTWAYFVVAGHDSWRKVKDAKQMAQFYHAELGLSETDLLSKKWDQVVDEIVVKQRQAELTHNRHDALDIANRIMRHDNYLIAMINCADGGAPLLPLGLGTFTVPSPIPCIPVSCRNSLNLPETLVLPTPPDFLSTTLLYALRWSLLDDMFDPATFTLREKYSGMDGAVALQNRFKFAAFISFIGAPFIALGMTMYLVLRHAEKILRRPAYATERRWNDLAKWKCRWFNEMEHVFDMRKEKSYKHADAYVEQFTSEVLGLLARFLTFVCGSLAGLLLVICSINNSLMVTTYYDRDLWWYLGTFSVVLGIMRSVGATPPVDVDPDVELKQLKELGFLAPKFAEDWQPKSQEVQKHIKTMYAPRFYNVFQEFTAIITTPLMLWTVYPQNADRILTFIRDSTVHSDSIGDVCGYAAFDFDRYGDGDWGTIRSEHTIHSKRKTPGGKMEKSFLSFKLSHPNWDSSGVRGMEAYPEAVNENLTQSVASLTQSMMRSGANDVEGGGGGSTRPPVRPARAAPGAAALGRSGVSDSVMGHMGEAQQVLAGQPAMSESAMLESMMNAEQYLELLGSGMEALEREHDQARQSNMTMGGAPMPGLGSEEYFGGAGVSRPASPGLEMAGGRDPV